MADIVQEIQIEAIPQKVFHAITTPEGITGWWANKVFAELKVGSLTEIRFDNGEIMKMEITDLEVSKKVHWKVRLAPHNWEGSTITWNLTQIPQGTRLLFSQRDLFAGDTGYDIEQTRSGWIYFLESLKAYVEAGEGTPYVY